jgi:hypothetical protein
MFSDTEKRARPAKKNRDFPESIRQPSKNSRRKIGRGSGVGRADFFCLHLRRRPNCGLSNPKNSSENRNCFFG